MSLSVYAGNVYVSNKDGANFQRITNRPGCRSMRNLPTTSPGDDDPPNAGSFRVYLLSAVR